MSFSPFLWTATYADLGPMVRQFLFLESFLPQTLQRICSSCFHPVEVEAESNMIILWPLIHITNLTQGDGWNLLY